MSLSYEQALSLGLDELRQREAMMRDDIDRDQGEYNVIRNAIAHLESVEQKEVEQQERMASNEEMKSSFELPKDYNALYNDDRLNDEIKGLINQVINQMGEHYELIIMEKDEENLNAIRDLREKYEETITTAQRERDNIAKSLEEAAYEAEDLRNIVKSLNEEKAKIAEELSAIKEQLAQATLEKQDAEQKRDAAVREVESLKAQIVELEQMTSKKHKPAGLTFNLTSSIQEDTPILSAYEIGLRNAGLGHMIKPKNVGGEPSGTSFQSPKTGATDNVASAEGTPTDQGDQVSREEFRDSGHDMGAGSTLVSETATCAGSATGDETISTAALKARIEAIEARLSNIERHPNIRISA